MSAPTANPDAIDIDFDLDADENQPVPQQPPTTTQIPSNADDNQSIPRQLPTTTQTSSNDDFISVDADEDNPDTSMMEAMGFSTFGSKPKPENKKRKFQGSPTFGTSANATPLGRPSGIPARPPPSVAGRGDVQHPQQRQSNTAALNIDIEENDEDTVKDDDIDSRSNYTETTASISGFSGNINTAALHMGGKNEKGDRAYFLPSFIEDPWRGMVAKRWSDAPV